MKRGEFLYKITHAKAALESVTLIPGETREIFFEQLAKKLDLNATKLNSSYFEKTKIPEGVLIADTYHVPKGIDENALITYLVDKSFQKHRTLAKEALDKYDEKKWFEKYVTIASIIQKEAAGDRHGAEDQEVAADIHRIADHGVRPPGGELLLLVEGRETPDLQPLAEQREQQARPEILWLHQKEQQEDGDDRQRPAPVEQSPAEDGIVAEIIDLGDYFIDFHGFYFHWVGG
jgi:hypothetical protein